MLRQRNRLATCATTQISNQRFIRKPLNKAKSLYCCFSTSGP